MRPDDPPPRDSLLASVDVTTPADSPAGLAAPLRRNPETTALLFDVDGVLAPIVANADDASVSDETLALLAALRDRYALVAVVSGRALADLDRMVPVAGLVRSGNHGLEIESSGGMRDVHPAVRPYMATMRAFAATWPEHRLAPHGVWMEDKGATLSLHHREAPDQDAAVRFLRGEVTASAQDAGLRTRAARMVLEILPPVHLDKGTAVRALITGTAVRSAMYVGDDHTDADAWRELRALRDAGVLDRALCLVADGPEVDPAIRALADTTLHGTAGVVDLMRALAR